MPNIKLYENTNIKSSILEENKISIWKEMFFISLLFIVSIFGKVGLILFFILLLLFFKQNEIGSIKILVLITYRTIFNPGLGSDISQVQILKWIYIFMCSIYLILALKKLNKQNKKKIAKVSIVLLAFFIINLSVNLLKASLPLVATFKLISYVFVFTAVIIGIGASIHCFNWIRWMNRLLTSIILISIPFIVLPIGYLRNGRSFQGITNHPNMLGIILVLAVAFCITDYQTNDKATKFWKIILVVVIAFIEMVLCESRTSMISFFLCVIFLLIASKKRERNILFFLGIIIIGLYIYWIRGEVINTFFINFFQKGNEYSLFYSRENQISNLISNIKKNPLFGSGFSVPILDYRSWKISFKYIIEPGNIILATISYCGIIGFLIFIVLIITIFIQNSDCFRKLFLLILVPLTISMGEMVFYSTNNMAILFYVMYGIYIFYSDG